MPFPLQDLFIWTIPDLDLSWTWNYSVSIGISRYIIKLSNDLSSDDLCPLMPKGCKLVISPWSASSKYQPHTVLTINCLDLLRQSHQTGLFQWHCDVSKAREGELAKIHTRACERIAICRLVMMPFLGRTRVWTFMCWKDHRQEERACRRSHPISTCPPSSSRRHRPSQTSSAIGRRRPRSTESPVLP